MKILVGIMYCIENEFDQCIASIKSQTHQDFEFFVVENLPNKLAHDTLYKTFMERAYEFDLFMKIDADMVLVRDAFFEEVIEKFKNDPELDDLSLAINDFFTNQLIHGLHIFSNRVTWPLSKEKIFVDTVRKATKKEYLWSGKLVPAAFHCFNSSPFQAFHFGIHKAVKLLQKGGNKINIEHAIIHHKHIYQTFRHYFKTKNKSLEYACLGVILALKHNFGFAEVDYNSGKLQTVFSKAQNYSELKKKRVLWHYYYYLLFIQNKFNVRLFHFRKQPFRIFSPYILSAKILLKRIWNKMKTAVITSRLKFKSKVVYTVLVGNYDELQDPIYVNKDWDYYCYTDTVDVETKVWKIIPLEDTKLDPVRTNRFYKILYHNFLDKYDFVLYVDSNIVIKEDLNLFISKVSNSSHDFFVPKHYGRDCIYEEGIECIKQSKDNPDKIALQLQKYKESGYPIANGLYANRVLLRKKPNEKLANLMEKWWEEVKNQSVRDQLSLPYVLWQQNYSKMESYPYSILKYFFQINKHTG